MWTQETLACKTSRPSSSMASNMNTSNPSHLLWLNTFIINLSSSSSTITWKVKRGKKKYGLASYDDNYQTFGHTHTHTMGNGSLSTRFCDAEIASFNSSSVCFSDCMNTDSSIVPDVEDPLRFCCIKPIYMKLRWWLIIWINYLLIFLSIRFSWIILNR